MNISETFKGSPVELIRINDGDGCYSAACVRGNWAAWPAQIGLMLTYPATLLVVNGQGPSR